MTGHDFRKLIRLPVLGCLLALTVAAVAKEQLPSQEDVPYGIASDYLIGRQLLKEGQYAEALGYLHLVYRTHPDVPAVAVDFQDALVAEGYFKDALEVMDRLVAAYPDSFAFLLQRSNLNVKLGNAGAALADLRTIRQQGGATVDVIIAEANLLAAQDDLNQALDVYRDGLQLFPEQGDRLYLGMVALLQRDGQDKAMLATLTEAVAEYPESPDLWLVKVRTLAAMGRHDEALDLARQADQHFLDREPEPDPEASGDPEEDLSAALPLGHPTPQPPESFLVELADFYVQQGQVQRGVDILAPMSRDGQLGLTPSLWLARIYLGTGQLDEGTRMVDKILGLWPDAGRGWFLKGKIVEAGDDWAGTIPHYEKAVELAPHDGEIRLALVRSMLVAWENDLADRTPDAQQRERRDRFEKQAVAALTLVPQGNADGQLVLGYAFRSLDDPWRAESCFELAAAAPELKITAQTQRSVCLDEMGDAGKARAVLEELHRDHPTDPEVANSLGYFLAEKGQDLEKARELIQLALDDQPGNGAFLDSMGWVLYRLGRTEAAFDYMIQAVNVLPDDPVILEHLGMVMLDLGQTQEARNMLQRAVAMGGDAERIGAVLEDLAGAGNTGEDSPENPDRP